MFQCVLSTQALGQKEKAYITKMSHSDILYTFSCAYKLLNAEY